MIHDACWQVNSNTAFNIHSKITRENYNFPYGNTDSSPDPTLRFPVSCVSETRYHCITTPRPGVGKYLQIMRTFVSPWESNQHILRLS